MGVRTTEREDGTFLFHEFHGTPSDRDVSQFLAAEALRLERANRAGRRLIVLSDLSDAEPITWAQRRAVASFNRDHSDVVARQVAAMVFVVPSIVIRSSMMAIFFIRRPATRVEFCATLAEGHRIARALHASLNVLGAPNLIPT